MALVVWLSGLSGAGKSTLSQAALPLLAGRGLSARVLDGDALRPVLSPGLGFGRADVAENNGRIARHCLGIAAEADVLLVPVIAPYAQARAAIRAILGDAMALVWVKAGLDTVMARDPKGLYGKARAGEIPDMVGYADGYPYEPPTDADLIIDTETTAPDEAAGILVDFIAAKWGERT